jgi:hypothetical protein
VDTFRVFLGTPSEKEQVPVTYIWMDDEQEEPELVAAPKDTAAPASGLDYLDIPAFLRRQAD